MENLETKMTKLVALYFLICEFKNSCPPIHFQRNSPNSCPAFSDEETLTIYLFGLLEGRRGVKSCYKLVKLYWTDWFPDLGSYQAFNRRINDLWPMLSLLIYFLNDEKLKTSTEVMLVDSLPAPISAGKRQDRAKVAQGDADKGFCASKEMFYYGFKVHIAAAAREDSTPVPVAVWVSPASTHDIQFLKQCRLEQRDCQIIGDKAYQSGPLAKELEERSNIELITIKRKPKGGTGKEHEAHNKKYSKLRQPIESLFNQIGQANDCFDLHTTRALNGAMRSIFGGVAAFMVNLALQTMI